MTGQPEVSPSSAIEEGRGSLPARPSVSIVMPVRNERKFAAATLKDLLAQDYWLIKEIIVVDGMSTDGTREIVQEFAAKDKRISLVDNVKERVSPALNIGIKASHGDIIVRADCHARYAADYVRQCVKCLAETGASNVGGPAVPRAEGGAVQRAIVAAHSSWFGVGVARFRRVSYEGPADTVWPGAFLRSAVEEVGPFSERFDRTEDIDFNSRLRASGHKVYISSSIRVWYTPRSSISGLCKQNFANGRGVFETLLVNPKAIRPRHLVPLAFVSTLIVAALSTAMFPEGKFFLSAIAGAYALPLVGACICAIRQAGVPGIFILPIVLVGLHISYGAGSLWGAAKAIWKGVTKCFKRS